MRGERWKNELTACAYLEAAEVEVPQTYFREGVLHSEMKGRETRDLGEAISADDLDLSDIDIVSPYVHHLAVGTDDPHRGNIIVCGDGSTYPVDFETSGSDLDTVAHMPIYRIIAVVENLDCGDFYPEDDPDLDEKIDYIESRVRKKGRELGERFDEDSAGEILRSMNLENHPSCRTIEENFRRLERGDFSPDYEDVVRGIRGLKVF